MFYYPLRRMCLIAAIVVSLPLHASNGSSTRLSNVLVRIHDAYTDAKQGYIARFKPGDPNAQIKLNLTLLQSDEANCWLQNITVSPDGQGYAFFAKSCVTPGAELSYARFDANTKHTLVESDLNQLELWGMAFSEDGRYLAYTAQVTDDSTLQATTNYHWIFGVYDVVSGEKIEFSNPFLANEPILNKGFGGALIPIGWEDDGLIYIAEVDYTFSRPVNLFVVSLTDLQNQHVQSDAVPVKPLPVLQPPNRYTMNRLELSPSGKSVALILYSADHPVPDVAKSYFDAAVKLVDLTNRTWNFVSAPSLAGIATSTWSTDGRYYFFVAGKYALSGDAPDGPETAHMTQLNVYKIDTVSGAVSAQAISSHYENIPRQIIACADGFYFVNRDTIERDDYSLYSAPLSDFSKRTLLFSAKDANISLLRCVPES